MRRYLTIAGLAAALAVPAVAAPIKAEARTYCDQRAHDRKVTGTVLGALGGALVGNAVSHKNGAVIGGIGGAVVGNQLARTKCDTGQRSAARPTYYRSASARCHMESRPFYDERGRLFYDQVRVCR